MKTQVIAIMVVALLAFGLAAGYLVGTAYRQPLTTTSTSFSTKTVTAASGSILHSEVILMNVNGSYYWADDVSRDAVMPNPGYGYFRNESITFGGVKFQTICPTTYQDCPGSNSSLTTVTAGAIRFAVTFPDGTAETVGDVIGDSIFTYVLSQHSPKAGMYIEYVNDYGNFNNSADYAVFLLISSCGGPPHLC